MEPPSQTMQNELLERLQDDRPLIAVELRPPKAGLSYAESTDVWIDMYHSIQRLVRRDTYLFLTDNAVGASEEENLGHLAANLAGDVAPSRITPFLTCKHTLDHCLMYAKRAASRGFETLTVLGGDTSVGPPRCVPHAQELRRLIREQVPSLTLGGWANPHRDPAKQAGYIGNPDFMGEFYLTQIVSHHSIGAVERFVEETRRREIRQPGVFGVFQYRSANPKTLSRLAAFFPVPAEQLAREFDAGDSAEDVCMRTVKALRDVGVDKIYLCNLGFSGVDRRYARMMEALGE